MQPTIAVIIANRNYSQWVVKAVNSARVQSYPSSKIHIIVADDGSTDNSIAKLNDHFQYAGLSPTVHVLELDKNPNVERRLGRGPSYARNKAIEYANEQIAPDALMILDADDEYLEDKIKISVEEWMKNPDFIGVVYSDYYIVDNDGNIKEEFKPTFSYKELLKYNIVHSCSLISMDAIKKCGVYDESLRTCEDYDLWCRIGKHYVIKHIPRFLMNVRTTGLNSTYSVSPEIWNSNLMTVRKRYDKTLHSQN
jgi:glycosyltransferase involved in cell wall biosynthesis